MSFHVFFDLSSGLSKPLLVPKGTLASILEHVRHVEATLGLETEQYLDNPPHWKNCGWRLAMREGISDETLCEEAEEHNAWIRWLYEKLGEWSENPPETGEKITPEDANRFWHALERITVDPSRWTEKYYRARMEAVYEVMRGREAEGMTLDTKALTPQQAAAVVRLFEQWLDPGDLRLDVPKGYDYLASSVDGGYVFCEKCGPVHPDEAYSCRKRGCPIREEDDE